MDANLIIDDDYVTSVGTKAYQKAVKLEQIFEDYILILEEIKSEALVSGEISEALETYIECVRSLKGQLKKVSESLKTICQSFLIDINEADDYLF